MDVTQCTLYAKLSNAHKRGVKQLASYLSTRLDLIQRYFPDYTDHGIGHSFRVLLTYCNILEKRGITNDFDDTQALLGICACLVHDIGMGPIYP